MRKRELPLPAHPPSWAVRWETRDLDELRAFFAPWGDHRRKCIGRGAFDFRVALVRLARGAIGWGEVTLSQQVHAVTRHPLLHVPLSAPITYRIGRRYLEAAPGSAVFLPCGTEYDLFYAPGRWLAVQLCGDGPESGFHPDPDGGRGRWIRNGQEIRLGRDGSATLSNILAAASIEPFTSGDRRASAVEEQLTQWFSSVLIPGASVSKGSIAAAERLRRVEEWIDAHAEEPIDLAILCRIAGIDVRGLQMSFRQRRGMTPTQWIRARRMAAARIRLLDAKLGETVTDIALASGLAHPSRFAVQYRRRYGESPSETLRLSRSR